MKILEHGSLPENAVKIHRCYNCRTKFEFQIKEATPVADMRDGDFFMIKCPVCNQPFSFTEKPIAYRT